MRAMLSFVGRDPLEMANHAKGMAFDQGLTLPPVHESCWTWPPLPRGQGLQGP